MFTEDKITEIFCIADDFCDFFDVQIAKYTQFVGMNYKKAITPLFYMQFIKKCSIISGNI